MRDSVQTWMEEFIKKYKADLRKDQTFEAVPTMRAAELEIEEIKQQLSERLLATYQEVRSQQAVEQMNACECGEPLPVHRWTHWTHGTLHGNVEVADPYGYCRTCHASQRPLHGILGMEPERWSLEVQRAAVDFGADHGFGKSEEKMAEHYPNVGITKSSIRRTTLTHGERAFAYVAAKLKAAAEAGLDKPWLRVGVAGLEVEYDSSNVRTGTLQKIDWGKAPPEYTAKRQAEKRQRVTEWKYVNVGAVHEPGKVDVLYTARFGETEAAFDDLFGLACLAGWSLNTITTGIADGARYIRTNLKERFVVERPAVIAVSGPSRSQFQFILDRPHAKQHLMAAGEILGPRQHKSAEAWADAKLDRIDKGGVDRVIASLKRAARQLDQDVLRQTVEYFTNNQDAVDYDRFREQGCSIGSGIAESAHTHVVQDRMKRPGTWWHPDTVDPMLALRVIRVNHWWEDYWKEQAAAYEARAAELRQQHLGLVA